MSKTEREVYADVFGFDDLRELFIPGKGKVDRVPNRLKKGFLKKSIFQSARKWISPDKPKHHQGEKETVRRRRQIERGILKVTP